jgi:hypothetical protein
MERPHPDMDRVRDALRERDDSVPSDEEAPPSDEEAPPSDEEAPPPEPLEDDEPEDDGDA